MVLRRPLTFETAFDVFSATEIIGQGGAAYVYKASDSSGQLCAIKLLDAKRTSTARSKRFKNEIGFCSRNEHPNIVSVIDRGIYSDNGQTSVFYVMPLYSGSFRDLLDRGILPEKALMYFSQILDGVEAAHLLGVVHRDLKPENILYDERNEHLLIADFGIAQFQEEDLYTAVETKETDRLANFQYAAPEQRVRGGEVGHRADIFALGLILNEMFTSEVISGTEPKAIATFVPEYAYLDEIVSEMIRQEPEHRLSSIQEIKRKLVARRNSFVSQQKVSRLRQTVIPESEVDDLLIADPPQLVDGTWSEGILTLVLSCPINDKWVQAFRDSGFGGQIGIDHGGFYVGLETIDFSENKATTRAPEELGIVQQVIDLFKDEWLPKANLAYKSLVIREKKETDERMRMQLQQELEREEARKKINDGIVI